MLDTMTLTKATASLCGTLLIFLLASWAARGIYSVDGHGEQAYLIETGEAEEVERDVVEMSFYEQYAAADAAKGEAVFRKCNACHKLEAGANGAGPYLYGVVGRDIGAADGFGYSSAMSSHGGVWTPEELNAFLLKPSNYMPGTSMSFSGLKKASDRMNVIAYMESIGN